MPFLEGTASQAFDLAVVGEVLAVGDGVALTIPFTIDKAKAAIDSLSIDYTTSLPHTANVSVDGVITGTDIISGTFDGKNGTITFSAAPTGDITGDYTSQGVLSQVVDFVTNRTKHTFDIGTGDGILTTFNFTIPNTPIVGGQCILRLSIGGVVYWMSPDNLGVYDHPQLASGSVNLSTGVGSITTVNPVDLGFVLQAIYTDSAVAGRDWILLREETTRDAAGVEEYSGELLKQVWLKNAGLSQKVNRNFGGIVLGYRESKDVTNDIFCIQGNAWKSFGEPEYTSTRFDSNTGIIPATYQTNGTMRIIPTMGLDDDDVTFWVSCTRSHILIAVRSLGVIYTHLIGGSMFPLSSHDNYPLPLFMKGNSNQPVSLTAANSHTSIVRSQTTTGTIHMYRPDGTYNDGGQLYRIQPRDDYGSSTPVLKNTTNNKLLLQSVTFFDDVLDLTYFEFPGVKSCYSNQVQAEDTVTDQNGRNYLILQEHTDTSEEDFFCVDKDL